MTKLKSIQEAFQQRIVTDEFDPNATYNIKERDLEWLFSHIQELENKYETESNIRAEWERQSLRHGYHLKQLKQAAIKMKESPEEMTKTIHEIMKHQDIENLLPDKYKRIFLQFLHLGWKFYQNEKREIVVTTGEKELIVKNIELLQTWLEGEINSQKTDS